LFIVSSILAASLACGIGSIGPTATPPAATFTSTPLQPTATPTPSQPTATPLPPPITDSEFAELAQETCDLLKIELLSIQELNAAYVDRHFMASESYQRAADRLNDIEITEEFASEATAFRTSLNELAEIYSLYYEAYINALNEIDNYEDASFIAISEDGETYIFLDEWIKLDIDIDLINAVIAAEETYIESANSLGLNACSEVDPIADSAGG
jgi:hypothetical protein